MGKERKIEFWKEIDVSVAKGKIRLFKYMKRGKEREGLEILKK